MASTYNPYSEIKSVYDAKIGYANATTDEERKKYQDAANKARQTLINYGRQDIADQISASGADANATKQIMDKWAKYGKTGVRDYYYNLGQGQGMSTADVDKLIGWDNDTKEFSFGGVKVGTPDAIVNGTSYVTDTSVLDKSFNDYIARSGTTRPLETALAQENESTMKKYNDIYAYAKDTNPFETAEGKAIMGKYDLAGLQARDNAVASGGASNGGNIDSYSAANAMRQQASLVSQGQTAVLDAHQQKIDNIRGILSDMGVNIDRVFNQDQTAKNNEVARLSEQASVTGTVPTEWSYKDNIYLNKDGTVRDEYLTDEFDATGGFTTIINNAKEKLKTATDAQEIANLNATIKYANQAKALKTFSSPKYAQYAHEVEAVAPDVTSPHYLENKAIDAGLEATKNTNETNLELGKMSADTQRYIAQLEDSMQRYITDANNSAAYNQLMLQMATLKESGDDGSGVYTAAMNYFDSTDSWGMRDFINDVLLPAMESQGSALNTVQFKDLIRANASENAYYLTRDDANALAALVGYQFEFKDTDADFVSEATKGSYDGSYKKNKSSNSWGISLYE